MFHLSLDTFEGMLSAKYVDDVSRDQFLQSLRWINSGMHASAQAFSSVGHHVIIDTVFERREWLVDCVRQLRDCPVLYVGVHCPTEELERRERERGDRRIGQAVEQLGWVHKHALYDLEVDTHTEGLDACARRIQGALLELDRCGAAGRMLAKFVSD